MLILNTLLAQLAGAIEYINYFSAEGVRRPPRHLNGCPGYDI